MSQKTVYILSRYPNLENLLKKRLGDNVQFKTLWLKDFDDNSKQFLATVDNDTIEKLKDAEILIADVDLVNQFFYKLPKAKWVQTTRAGNEPLTDLVAKTGKKPNFVVTRFSGSGSSKAISDYVIANIINWERGFHNCQYNKSQRKW